MVGFFDGACRRRDCGCGVVIYMSPDICFHFWWEGGQGTNNKAEIMALWEVLTMAKWLSIQKFTVFRDAKCVIDWVNDFTNFAPLILKNWMSSIRMAINKFQEIQLQHIYRKQNWRADMLSKRGIAKDTGKIFFTEFSQGK